MGKCDVCGKETNTFVACSACGAVSYAYCEECLNNGLEPYSALVGMDLYFDDISEDFKQQILLPSLRVHGKTPAEFDADVKKLDDDFYNWLQHQDECVEYECKVGDFNG